MLDGQFEIEHLINGHLEGHREAQLFAQAELDRDVPLDLQGLGKMDFHLVIKRDVSLDIEQGRDAFDQAPCHRLFEVDVGLDPDPRLFRDGHGRDQRDLFVDLQVERDGEGLVHFDLEADRYFVGHVEGQIDLRRFDNVNLRGQRQGLPHGDGRLDRGVAELLHGLRNVSQTVGRDQTHPEQRSECGQAQGHRGHREDDYGCGGFHERAAKRPAALCRVSSYSEAGSESATNPEPTP